MADLGSKSALQTDINDKCTTNGANENTGLRIRTLFTNLIDTVYAAFGMGSITTTSTVTWTAEGTPLDNALEALGDDLATKGQAISDLNTGKEDAVPTYIAKLSQSGTSAPVATVLLNTLGGTVVWTRASAGDYRATLAGAFATQARTCIVLDPNKVLELYQNEVVSANYTRLSADEISIAFSDTADDWMGSDWYFEVKVYPA